MKVSIILPAFFGSGGIDVVYEYSRRLMHLGHNVVIYVPLIAYNLHGNNIVLSQLKQVYSTVKNLKLSFIDNISLQLNRKENVIVKAVPSISNRFIEESDIIMATAWCTAYDVSKLEKSKGTKFYFIQDYEVWDNEILGKDSYKLPLKKITIANRIKDILIRECGCINENIEVINNGIDMKIYHPNDTISKSKNINCLMLDHHLEKKGVKYGVEAFKIAKKTIPSLKLTMFGIKRSKYAPKDIDYYENPSQDEIVKLYQKSDIFIYPSIEEGWGLTPIEAMACKCAVVGTETGCMLDIGKNNENVILCNTHDAEDLANGIVSLAIDSNFRKNISDNAYESIKKLDWEISAKKFEKVLKSDY